MKKSFVIIFVSFLSWLAADAQNAHTVSVPSKSTIPKEYQGHWQKGSFSLTSFEEYNGRYVGPANEMSISYVIDESGIAREYFISNTNSYNCRMQILGYREGKIMWNTEDNSFEFRPASGYYSTLTCMSKTATKKAYGTIDLYPNYRATGFFKRDENGAFQMILKRKDNTEGLSLKKIK
jgi:hypothetical protein